MKLIPLIFIVLQTACAESDNRAAYTSVEVINDSDLLKPVGDTKTTGKTKVAYKPNAEIQTGANTPAELISFATTLTGTTYKYGSTDPLEGFDCSGFITYVFNHFNIAVPRSSVDFTNVEPTVSIADARPGDLILFTGTDSTIRVVGHMGIITDNKNGALNFIHSTSGKQYGVTITPLNSYYMGRFVKIVRVFK